jgi:hypothetical protein
LERECLPSREADARIIIYMKGSTGTLEVLALSHSDRLPMSVHSSNSGSRRRQHDTTMTLIVAIQEHLNHRMILAYGLHSGMAECGVGNAQDQLMNETLIAIESILVVY